VKAQELLAAVLKEAGPQVLLDISLFGVRKARSSTHEMNRSTNGLGMNRQEVRQVIRHKALRQLAGSTSILRAQPFGVKMTVWTPGRGSPIEHV
jgi:hypothetical protein